MKISFFIGGLIGGGAERVTCNLSNFLVSKGCDVQIITMSETESYPLLTAVKNVVLLNHNERGNVVVNYIKRYKALRRFLKVDDSDCYIVMLPITTTILLLLKKHIKSPVIAAERCYPAVLSQTVQRLLLLLLAKRANAWVFQTQQQKEWYGKAVTKTFVKIIPNSVNMEFVVEPYKGERKKEIIAVGRLSPQKNYELLIRAFASIVNNYPLYNLIIYGEGEKRKELERFIEDMKLQNRVLMPGYEKDISTKLKQASLYVLSSNFEGIPNTLMEAMALGVPSIATDCDGGGSGMLIKNGINGLLVPKGDEKALANAMDKMLSDKDFANSCGLEAHKICETLAPENIYNEWLSFIQYVVKNN